MDLLMKKMSLDCIENSLRCHMANYFVFTDVNYCVKIKKVGSLRCHMINYFIFMEVNYFVKIKKVGRCK